MSQVTKRVNGFTSGLARYGGATRRTGTHAKRRTAFALLLGIALIRGGAAATADEPFTLALTGDSIIMQRLAVFKEPQFTGLFDLIRGADAAFTNLETLFHDYEMPPALATRSKLFGAVTTKNGVGMITPTP